MDSSKSPEPRPVALSRVWEGPGGGGHGAGGGDSVPALALVSSRAAIPRLYSRYGVDPATHTVMAKHTVNYRNALMSY